MVWGLFGNKAPNAEWTAFLANFPTKQLGEKIDAGTMLAALSNPLDKEAVKQMLFEGQLHSMESTWERKDCNWYPVAKFELEKNIFVFAYFWGYDTESTFFDICFASLRNNGLESDFPVQLRVNNPNAHEAEDRYESSFVVTADRIVTEQLITCQFSQQVTEDKLSYEIDKKGVLSPM